jgi:hypothetical protein
MTRTERPATAPGCVPTGCAHIGQTARPRRSAQPAYSRQPDAPQLSGAVAGGSLRARQATDSIKATWCPSRTLTDTMPFRMQR